MLGEDQELGSADGTGNSGSRKRSRGRASREGVPYPLMTILYKSGISL
jgi:hypothetical protein